MITKKVYDYAKYESKMSLDEYLTHFFPKRTSFKMPSEITFNTLDEVSNYLLNNKDKKVVIVGDYDTDGISATAIMYKTLTWLGFNVSYIIPNRFSDGYGLRESLVDEAYKLGAGIILTVDNGINAINAINYARGLSIEVIVTDHHLSLGEEWKNIKYVINPHTNENNLETKEVCGAYVALVSSLDLIKKSKKDIDTTELYEFASIATISDVMPVLNENKTLLEYQIKKWESYGVKNIGLKRLIEKEKLTTIDKDSIGFYLVPALNAPGRLDSAYVSLNIFICDDINEIDKNIEKLLELNNLRKKLTEEVFLYVKSLIDLDNKIQVINIDKSIFNYDENILEGIIGLVSAKVVTVYKLPAVIFYNNKFSSRTTKDINLYDLISFISPNFKTLSFGGHKEACGGSLDFSLEGESFLKLLNENIEKFEINYQKNVIKLTKDITPKKLNDAIKVVSPCDNMPEFMMEDIEAFDYRLIGKTKEHFSFISKINGEYIKYLKFNKTLSANRSFVVKNMTLKPTYNDYSKEYQYIIDEIEI